MQHPVIDISDSNLISRLPQVRGQYIHNSALAHKVWFQVGGPAEVLYKPADAQDLIFFLKNKPQDIPVTTLGVGSNVLIRDGGIAGVVIRLGRALAHITCHDDLIEAGAGILDHTLALTACARGISGFEFMAGIPGTLGGALRMNAGCYGHEIKDRLVHALALDPLGHLHVLSPADMKFSYRHCDIPSNWIFIGARLQGLQQNPDEIEGRMKTLLQERELSQPVRTRTGGSTFANPAGLSAWRLIDEAGCRGLRMNGAVMSEKHCNFMINDNSARACDLESLGQEVQKRVLAHSGVELRWEIQRLGHMDLLVKDSTLR